MGDQEYIEKLENIVFECVRLADVMRNFRKEDGEDILNRARDNAEARQTKRSLEPLDTDTRPTRPFANDKE